MGFGVPLGVWFRRELRELTHSACWAMTLGAIVTSDRSSSNSCLISISRSRQSQLSLVEFADVGKLDEALERLTSVVSNQNFAQYASGFHARQSPVEPLEFDAECFVVDTQQVEHGRMEIVHGANFFDCPITELVVAP